MKQQSFASGQNDSLHTIFFKIWKAERKLTSDELILL
jgi:hypothetical protein